MRALLCAKFAEASLPLRPNETPIFLADAMLGSVARKLRAFGFDTIYLVHTDEMKFSALESQKEGQSLQRTGNYSNESLDRVAPEYWLTVAAR